MGPALQITLATIAYGVLHSFLASRSAKRFAARAVGEANARVFYRPFYIVQALVTTTALFVCTYRMPAHTLYHVRGVRAMVLRSGQLLALLHAYRAAREVGLLRLSGGDSVLLRAREGRVALPPAAQGPERDPQTRRLSVGGPFRWSRHPLNFSAVPLFWMTPRLTTGRLAFNAVATVYLVLGSLHEELRLRDAYGNEYVAYQQSGVPFFMPWPRRAAIPSTQSEQGAAA
jgi:protein-S-isoprenylcysteine O-methyltransferase Ste14